MVTEAAPTVVRMEPAAVGPAAELVIAAHVTRRVARGALLWGLVFGTVVYSSLVGLTSAYPTVASRQLLARTIEDNVGIQALFGRAHDIANATGFTAWRSMGVLSLIGSIWGLLTATRLLRGEEEDGRWELLVAGPTTRRRATATALGGLLAGGAVLWLTAAVIVLAVGTRHDARFAVTSSLFFATALAAPAVVFVVVGAVTSQLAATRRQAAMVAGVVFGLAYLLRLVADSEHSLSWVRATSPLGWVEELRPLTGSRPSMLLPLAAFVVAGSAVAVALAGTRDLGSSVLRDRDTAEARTALLGRPLGLAVRLARPAVVGWSVAVVITGFVMGLVAKGVGDATAGSTFMQQMLGQMGGRASGARLYLGLAFLVVTTMTCLAVAGQVAATRDEEAEGRVDNLLARPVARPAWLGGRLAVTAAMVVVLGVLSGLAAWAGAATQHAGIGVGGLLEAGLNMVPPAVLVLGIGTLVHAVAPRATAAAVYGVVAWSFLVELVGAMVKADPHLLDLSIFHHVAPVPAADPRWGSALILVALGAAAAAAGIALLGRRDLTGV